MVPNSYQSPVIWHVPDTRAAMMKAASAPTICNQERRPALAIVTVAPPGSVTTSPAWNVPTVVRSFMNPVAGIAPPAAAGVRTPVAQTRNNSPVAADVPPVTPLVPSAPSAGTFPVEAVKGSSQTVVPSIRTEPPSTALHVMFPSTAACCAHRTSELIVSEPPLFVMVSPGNRLAIAGSS